MTLTVVLVLQAVVINSTCTIHVQVVQITRPARIRQRRPSRPRCAYDPIYFPRARARGVAPRTRGVLGKRARSSARALNSRRCALRAPPPQTNCRARRWVLLRPLQLTRRTDNHDQTAAAAPPHCDWDGLAGDWRDRRTGELRVPPQRNHSWSTTNGASAANAQGAARRRGAAAAGSRQRRRQLNHKARCHAAMFQPGFSLTALAADSVEVRWAT